MVNYYEVVSCNAFYSNDDVQNLSAPLYDIHRMAEENPEVIYFV